MQILSCFNVYCRTAFVENDRETLLTNKSCLTICTVGEGCSTFAPATLTNLRKLVFEALKNSHSIFHYAVFTQNIIVAIHSVHDLNIT